MKGRRGTYQSVILLDEKDALTMVSQPDTGVGTGSTTADDNNITVDGLCAAIRGGGSDATQEKRGHEARAHLVASHFVLGTQKE